MLDNVRSYFVNDIQNKATEVNWIKRLYIVFR